MRYLLDTHAFLWCFQGSEMLGKKAKSIILDTDTRKYISIASIWEFSIKYGLGKLEFEGGLSRLWEIITKNGFIILPITQAYLSTVIELPSVHRDPFDRMLVATAQAEGLIVLTADENIPLYGVSCIW